jgi:hypothetical protein
MLFKDMDAINSENHAKCTNIMCGGTYSNHWALIGELKKMQALLRDSKRLRFYE